MWNRKKKKVVVSLPNEWTAELWNEVWGSSGSSSLNLGIETFKSDIALAYGSESAAPSRSYGGFIGGPEGSRKRLLRASLNFTEKSERWESAKFPEGSNGWGQTDERDNFPPSLGFVVFATREVQSAFETLFVRAKVLGIPFLNVNIRGNVLEGWPNDSDRFVRVMNVTSFNAWQNLALGGPISEKLLYDHPWGF